MRSVAKWWISALFSVSLRSTLALCLAAVLFVGTGPAAGETSPIAGTWKGAYVCGQGKTGATVTVKGEAGGRLTGEFSFYPPPGVNNPSGRYGLVIQHDTTTGKIVLRPTRWIERPRGYRTIPLVGVLSPDRNRIVGKVQSRACGAFELVREGARPAKTTGTRASFRPLKPPAANDAFCRRFVAWTKRLEVEYPGVDFYRTSTTKVYPRAANLFADAAMIDLFGKPFDSLSEAERKSAILPALRFCTREWQGRNALDWEDQMTRPFSLTRGSFSAEEVTRLVGAYRRQRQWAREAMNLIEKAGPGEKVLADIRRIRLSVETAMVDLWPSERKAVEDLANSRFQDLALETARKQLADAPGNVAGLRVIDRALEAARKDGVAERLKADVATRRDQIRAAIAADATASVAARPATFEGLKAVADLRKATADSAGQDAVVTYLDPAITAWARKAAPAIRAEFVARIEGMPETVAGLNQARALHKELTPAFALLGEDAAADFEKAVTERGAQVVRTVEAMLQSSIDKYAPKTWREIENLKLTVETAAKAMGIAKDRIDGLSQHAIDRVPALAEQVLPTFEAELQALSGWAGLAQLEIIAQRLGRIRAALNGFDTYEATLRQREAALLSEVAGAERDKLASWGASHADVPALLQAADDIAASFEALDDKAGADTMVEVALVRAENLAAASLQPFLGELAGMQPELDSPPKLTARADSFDELAGFAPSFAAYAEALRQRAIDMEFELCEPAFAATGLPVEVADVPVLADKGSLSVFRLACLLDRNGNKLEDMTLEDDGSIRMRMAREDGSIAIAKLHEIEYEQGSPVLLGYELGDLNRQDEITVSAWQAFIGDVARERPTGIADKDGVTHCDKVAADPSDPKRIVEGVPDDALDIAYATEACLAAVETNSSEARLRYQLARVFSLSGETESAAPLMEELAGEGYAAGQFGQAELLLLKEDGFDAALALYKAAAAGGYDRAREQVAALSAPVAESGASAALAAVAEEPEPTEAEMRAAFTAETRRQYDCDIVSGCTVMGMLKIQLTRFQKHECGSLGGSKQLCSYSGQISCRTSTGGVYDKLVCGNFGAFGPTEKVFLKAGAQWKVVQ